MLQYLKFLILCMNLSFGNCYTFLSCCNTMETHNYTMYKLFVLSILMHFTPSFAAHLHVTFMLLAVTITPAKLLFSSAYVNYFRHASFSFHTLFLFRHKCFFSNMATIYPTILGPFVLMTLNHSICQNIWGRGEERGVLGFTTLPFLSFICTYFLREISRSLIYIYHG